MLPFTTSRVYNSFYFVRFFTLPHLLYHVRDFKVKVYALVFSIPRQAASVPPSTPYPIEGSNGNVLKSYVCTICCLFLQPIAALQMWLLTEELDIKFYLLSINLHLHSHMQLVAT